MEVFFLKRTSLQTPAVGGKVQGRVEGRTMFSPSLMQVSRTHVVKAELGVREILSSGFEAAGFDWSTRLDFNV